MITKSFDPASGDYTVTVSGNIAAVVAETKYKADGYAGGSPIRGMVRTGVLLPNGAETAEVLTLPEGVYAVKAGDDWPDAAVRREQAYMHEAASALAAQLPHIGKPPEQIRAELAEKQALEAAKAELIITQRG